MQQLTLTFEPGLSERHTSLKACMRECVYANDRPLKTIAADMDVSESDLTRKLGENDKDKRNLTCDDLEAYIWTTGDHTPIYYLIEKFAVSTESKAAYAAAEFAKALPQMLALARQMGVKA